MRLCAFAASLRRASLNRRLLEVVVSLARAEGAEVEVAEFRQFDMPLFDGDLQAERGLPDGALELKRRIEASDGLIIASPEYNYSIPGVLKNAIDWVSRARPIPFKGKTVYLCSASPSAVGGIRGLWQTRIPLEGLGALVFPEMFALPHADRAFADDGKLGDATSLERLRRQVASFVLLTDAVTRICGNAATGHVAEARRLVITEGLENESKLQG